MTSTTDVRKIDVSGETGNWYPRRSDLRYTFIATIEVRDAESGKQIVSATSNLTSYGCQVRTSTPFLPGTPVKLTIKHQGITFRSLGKVDWGRGNGHSLWEP